MLGSQVVLKICCIFTREFSSTLFTFTALHELFLPDMPEVFNDIKLIMDMRKIQFSFL